MRRFSQRNHLVTLSDINITPLLDLAFVLLIIFVITTPLLEKSLKLELPGGGQEKKSAITKNDVRTVEIARGGDFYIGGKRMSLNEIEVTLVQAFKANPKLGVIVRADTKEELGNVAKVMDICERTGIFRFDIATRDDKR